jgi:DNA-directed RNA polymerase specialized sigma24 family protein
VTGREHQQFVTRRALEPTHLEGLLKQLSPDREQAGRHYEQLRRRLITVFACRRCLDPEALADETLDRVARKIAESPDWAGDAAPATPLVFGVAWNVARESFRERRPVSMPDGWDPASATRREDADEAERTQRCLDSCLSQLSAKDRNLLLAYFRETRGTRIALRSSLAKELGLSAAGLRVKVHRLVNTVRACVVACSGRVPRRSGHVE